MRIVGEPRPHFSFSQMDSYLACPHKYYLGYEQGLQWCFIPSVVVFGSVIHSVLEGFHRSLIALAPQSSIHLEKRFEQEWVRETQKDSIRFKNKEEQKVMLQQGKALVELYHEQFHPLKPKAVELDFRMPMIRTDTGELGKRDIVGKIDMVENGNIPWEIKTGSKSISQSQADSNMQLTLYSWALSMMYGEHVGTVKVVNLVRTKTPKIQVIETERTPEDHQKLMRVLFGVNDAIEKKVFFANPKSIYGCGNCTYSPVCEYAMI